ncbi:PRC-barrel domain-containing protein [Donghicola sp. XS_ASV15]|uniref:PRC-barrel domain-containing protein n=1 Tax=Donghicola sp. XS_ASV15 TaxID=3241295 RepID=UPI0035142C9A
MTFMTKLMTAAATTALMTGAAYAEMSNTDMDAQTEVDGQIMMEQPMDGDTAIGTTTDMGTQADAAPVMPMDEGTTEMALAQKTVDDVIGMEVEAINGEDVGEIDYVIAGETGVEAVVGVGGFLGLGEYTVALPLNDFAVAEDETLILSQDADALKQMPQIDESAIESLPGDMVIANAMNGTVAPGMPDNS